MGITTHTVRQIVITGHVIIPDRTVIKIVNTPVRTAMGFVTTTAETVMETANTLARTTIRQKRVRKKMSSKKDITVSTTKKLIRKKAAAKIIAKNIRRSTQMGKDTRYQKAKCLNRNCPNKIRLHITKKIQEMTVHILHHFLDFSMILPPTKNSCDKNGFICYNVFKR
jgi:hypothetical protein